MNSFRKAILTGKGLKGDPVVPQKSKRGAVEDDLSSVDVPRGEERSQNHRDDDRHRLEQETITVRFEGQEYQADLINLSGGGAMIRAEFSPRLWERVDLIFAEDSEIECAVRWLRDDRVGLEFAHETKIECDAETRDKLLLDVIRRSFGDVKLTTAKRDEMPIKAAPAAKVDDDVANSRRAERRHPLVWMGQVFYNHDSEKVRLRNISENGALIEAPYVYPLGAEIYLDLDDAGQHFATVSWTFGDKIGLKFKDKFDLRVLGKSRPVVTPSMLIRPGPTQATADQDNPWAEGWNRQSIDDLRDDLEGFLKR
ncbi:PilZ domain-containing protein [Sphingomonas sp.]|uniref:PilZ domain-containing protein n=1 Tax=Sphingomonas sp. TaxID=28214 RepID=UPI0025EC2C6F|nr:PilZ domain-containing protein [Sphingomonas sp.]